MWALGAYIAKKSGDQEKYISQARNWLDDGGYLEFPKPEVWGKHPAEYCETQWKSTARSWAWSGRWMPHDGPMPGEHGCLMPSRFLPYVEEQRAEAKASRERVAAIQAECRRVPVPSSVASPIYEEDEQDVPF